MNPKVFFYCFPVLLTTAKRVFLMPYGKCSLKTAKPGVTDEQWAAVKKEVFDIEVAELSKQLIPTYKIKDHPYTK